ncbi:unnamed protein product [Pseudo-nitzschia multistriata]|uniref:KH type-2 domain-containing protein n=1 Tax=Pseudo-nitzschia multistriata TaxID=183589 RepID=A0A448Z3N9_9STRA|nr:unnamed protein product [Pseudo-nitzschia multistriata]
MVVAVSLFLLSPTLNSDVAAFRSNTIGASSHTLSQRISSINTINPSTSLFMAPSSNENSKRRSGKPKSKNKTKKKPPADTLLILKELEEKIDSYDGRLPSKMPANRETGDINLSDSQHQQHRCGFVGIVGAPNMGKSTLLNALLKEDLCIATRRPQTTRHAILGVLSSPTRQCCLLDTPGVLQGDGAYKLQANMMEAVKGALKDSDVLLVVTDMFSTPIPNDEIFRRLSLTNKPILVVVNKIDLEGRAQRPLDTASDEKNNDENEEEENEKTYTVAEAVAKWRNLLPNALAIIPMTAAPDPSTTERASESDVEEHPGIVLLRQLLVGSGKDEEDDIPASVRALGRPVPGMFRNGIKCLTNDDARNLLPVGPPLYDDDFLSDRSVRFFCSELIREALLESRYLKKELPYCCEVQITEFKEPRQAKELTRIEATIFVERDGQKAIVVGKNGNVIKQVGIIAREKIERFLDGEKVFLKLQVKVDKDWRKKDDALTKFGYSR